MKDERKTKRQLVAEVAELRQQLAEANRRIAELETEEAGHKQAEEALRESEERSRTMLESSIDNLYRRDLKTDTYDYMSPAVERILGYPVEEMLSMPLESIVSMMHPDDIDNVKRVIGESLTSDRAAYSLEYRFRDKEGQYRWLSDLFTVIRDAQGHPLYLVGSVRDITEGKRAEEALRDSRHMLQTVLDSIPAAVFWKDRDSIYLGGNRTFLQAAGVKSSEEVVGKSDYDLPWEKKQADSFREDDRRVMESGIAEYDIIEPYLRADGTHAWAKTNKVPLRDTEGNVVGVLGTYEDITERKRAEEALQESARQLRALSTRLAEAEEIERRRIARELHDRVGQNLTALGINLNIVRSQLPEEMAGPLGSRLEDSLTLVDDTTESVRSVMADLRPPVLDDYGLTAALRWYAERFAERTEIAVTVEGEELDPRLLPRVENALFRIAQEALINVSKHAQAAQANVSLGTDGETIRMTVIDNGVGFDTAESDGSPGWGLLTMSERAEAVGGQCRVESRPGQGTRVVVEVARAAGGEQ